MGPAAFLFLYLALPLACAARVKRTRLSADHEAVGLANASVDQEAPGLGAVSPGMTVTYTSRSGKSYTGTVKSAEMVPMVTISTPKGDRMVPLSRIKIESGSEEESEDSGGGEAMLDHRHPLNIRQRIICDVCLRKLGSCSSYEPRKSMLSPVRGEPESPNRRYYTCPPSERELWTEKGRFKVVESSSIPSLGDRTKCPEERRAPKIYGKLPQARRICNIG